MIRYWSRVLVWLSYFSDLRLPCLAIHLVCHSVMQAIDHISLSVIIVRSREASIPERRLRSSRY